MDEHERDEPDFSEDPRKKGVSDQQPEENPEGQVPGSGGDDPGAPAPESGTGGADAPDTSHPEEGDPGRATGNPNAAG
ncbi:MAG: hypothetical protein JWO74_4644 [Solirubrobacterales bacterium]|jgi:hypothetical protein|nr:hypothetical protein [Solirubrobacterales bacterium]